jgi:hypothetical protein
MCFSFRSGFTSLSLCGFYLYLCLTA